MKKIILVLTLIVALFALFGCDNTTENETDNNPPTSVTPNPGDNNSNEKPLENQNPGEDNPTENPGENQNPGDDNPTENPGENQQPGEDNPTENPEENPTVVPDPNKEREIVVDYETQTIYVPSERDLRIAQFADLHFNINYNGVAIDCSNEQLERTYQFMEQVITETDPDIIVCSGDNILTTGVKGLEEFVKLMESYQIPWVFMYGNHEAESNTVGYRKTDLSNFLKTYETNYLIYDDEYIEEYKNTYREERYGNFVMEVCDLDTNELKGAYIFFDAGVYDSASLGDYQRITTGQMTWYSNQIDNLQAKYTGDGVVPTIVFSHIQLPEFYYGYKDALTNTNNTKFVIHQDLSTVDWDPTSIKSILNNSPKTDNGMFDLMVSKGSTKAYFVGHSHNLWFQVEKEGILLGYGPQTGFSIGFETNWDPRKTYVYNVNNSFEVTTTSVDEEDVVPDGLACKYFDSSNGDYILSNDSYDELTGTYTIKVMFKKYSARVIFYFNGEALAADKITMTGDVVASSAQKTDTELYINYYKYILIYSWQGVGTYTITYNPETQTLNIKAPDKIETEDNSGLVYTGKYINTDSNTDVTGSVSSSEGYHYLNVNFTQEYGRITFKYNGFTLTPDNTTFKGLFLDSTNTDWSNKLYWSPDNPGELLSATGGNYTFVYDPASKTMYISSPESKVFQPTGVNKDTTAMSVWTEAQTEIYTGADWIGNGWRLYIVVDRDGKIAYCVFNPPNGYGGAMASSYIRHSDYSDYTTNPAFSYLSEPYEGKWGMTVNFKVAIPEGGFAITAYGDSKNDLIHSFLDLTDASAAAINKKTNNVDSVRISYDQETGLITITK